MMSLPLWILLIKSTQHVIGSSYYIIISPHMMVDAAFTLFMSCLAINIVSFVTHF